MSVRAKDVGVGSRYTLSDGWEPGPLQHKLDKLFNLSEQRRCISESLKPRRRVGRKNLVRLESFARFYKINHKIKPKRQLKSE